MSLADERGNVNLIGNGGHAKVVRTLKPWGTGERWICAVGTNRFRKKEVEAHPEHWWVQASYLSPMFYNDAQVGEGTVIMAGVIIQPGCRIGKHVILNTGCTVDHDTVIEDYAHIAPGAHLCGGCHIGEGALVGVGVGLAPGTRILPWTLVKAHAIRMEPLP